MQIEWGQGLRIAEFYGVCRSIRFAEANKNHSTTRTGMSSFSLGLNQLIAFGNRGSNQPLCCSQGQRLKGGKTCSPLWLWSSRITVSLILLCSVALVASFFAAWGYLAFDGSYWFLFGGLGSEFSRKSPQQLTRCRTGPAPPEGLRAPKFHAVSATQAVVNISAPRKPNGIVTLYRLFSRSTSGAQTVVSSSILIGLLK